MGHRNLNLAVLLAGCFTLGAVFAGQNQAKASSVIECAEVVILSTESWADDCDGENEADDSICGIVER